MEPASAPSTVLYSTGKIPVPFLFAGEKILLRMGLDFVGDRKVVEASVVIFAAMAVFRGGIQLVKVATAAHVCITAEQRPDNS